MIPNSHDKVDIVLVDSLIELVRLRRVRKTSSLSLFALALSSTASTYSGQRVLVHASIGPLDFPFLFLQRFGQFSLSLELSSLAIQLELRLGERLLFESDRGW